MSANPSETSEIDTSGWRWVAAIAAAWLIPSFAVAAWYYAVGKEPLSDLLDPGVLLLGIIIPFYALVVGWIPLTGAFIAWTVLHRLRRTGRWPAVGVGLLAGAAAPWLAMPMSVARLSHPHALAEYLSMTAFTTLLGAVVALIVRRLAYGKVS